MLDFHKVVPLWQIFLSSLAFFHFLMVRVVIAVFWHVSKVVFNLVRLAYLLLEVSRLLYFIKRTTIQYLFESLLDIRNDFCYLGQPLTVFTLRILLISADRNHISEFKHFNRFLKYFAQSFVLLKSSRHLSSNVFPLRFGLSNILACLQKCCFQLLFVFFLLHSFSFDVDESILPLEVFLRVRFDLNSVCCRLILSIFFFTKNAR